MPESLSKANETVKFSICTLVTRQDEYEAMLKSFQDAGFGDDCEFLYRDNTRANDFEAFGACNDFLNTAKGTYIILCHQDIVLNHDVRADLEIRLRELDLLDPFWGLCGNAGGAGAGRRYARISDPHGLDQRRGPFPSRVTSLDENFILVKRKSNLALSRDMAGFHLYGTDLCIIADVLGWSAWVIDFHLTHNSGGTVGAAFHEARDRLVTKYRKAFRTRWVTSTCTTLLLTGSRLTSPVEFALKARRWLRTRL